MFIFRHLLYDFHAAIEIGVERQGQSAVGYGLNKLRDGYFVFRKKHDGRNADISAISGQRCRRIACRRTGNPPDISTIFDHLIDHRDQNGHPQIFK